MKALLSKKTAKNEMKNLKSFEMNKEKLNQIQGGYEFQVGYDKNGNIIISPRR